METITLFSGNRSGLWVCVEWHQGFATVYANDFLAMEVRYCYRRDLPWAVAYRDRIFLKVGGERVAFATPEDAALWIERYATGVVPFTARDAA